MAKKYQRRLSELAAVAWARGHITPLELFRVAAWKTGQGLGSLTTNTEEQIQDRTRAALDTIRPWRDQPVSALTSVATWANWRETAREGHRRRSSQLRTARPEWRRLSNGNRDPRHLGADCLACHRPVGHTNGVRPPIPQAARGPIGTGSTLPRMRHTPATSPCTVRRSGEPT